MIEVFLTITEMSKNESNDSNSDEPEKGVQDDDEEDEIENNSNFEVADNIAVEHKNRVGLIDEENVINNNDDSDVDI